jgi:hypothetical protein
MMYKYHLVPHSVVVAVAQYICVSLARWYSYILARQEQADTKLYRELWQSVVFFIRGQQINKN